MKKVISVLMFAIILITSFSFAASAVTDANKSTWTLKASVLDASSSGKEADKDAFQKAENKTVYDSKNSPTVSVYPGQVVWITLHLKTGSSLYAGTLQAPIYYSSSVFTSTTLTSAKSYVWYNGKYAGICIKDGAPYSKMVDSYKETNYPPTWSAEKKKATEFYSVIMIPNSGAYTNTYASVDEDLVSVPIYVKSGAKVGDTGSIFVSSDDVKTKSNPTGTTILSTFNKGDITKAQSVLEDKSAYDMSKAEIKFVVADKNSKDMSLSESSMSLNYKQTKQLTAQVKGASNPKVTWESSDTSVAAVDENGNVTATGKGTAVITAKYGSMYSTCQVTVKYTFVQTLIRIFLFGWIWY